LQLLNELKRRNVIRMAGIYLVGAWLIVQVAETLLPVFGTPDWVLKTLLLLLAIGFVPALVVSWVFELTPEGLQRDRGADATRAEPRPTSQRMDRLLLVGLVLVVGVVAADRFWPQGAAPAAVAADPITPGAASGEAPTTAPAVQRGLAVLPFGNLSPDPDNAFFAGGIYEEVLTRVSRIHDLRVISRTSMENIAAEKLEVPEIGRRLGVSHVLEGSVRRAGDTVRITVQLIEAATDKHIWAENFDRKLDDVFAIQSEIALAIASQMQVALTASEQRSLGERPTNSAEAYDLYLRAVEQQRTWRGAEGFRDLIVLLEPAVALDPGFAEARVALAEAYGRMYWLGEDPDGSYRAKAEQQLAEIQKGWPDQWHSRLARAQYLYTVERDYAGALAILTDLQAERPNDVGIATTVAAAYKRLNRHTEHLAAVRRALLLDPESPLVGGELAIALDANGLGDEAIAQNEKVLRRIPEDFRRHAFNAALYARYRGDRRPMLALGDEIRRQAPGMVAPALFSEGKMDEIVALLEQQRQDLQGPSAMNNLIYQAELLRLAGRVEEALRLAKMAFAQAQAWVKEGKPAPSGMQAAWLANVARIAAGAGERAQAEAWAAQSRTTPVLALEEQDQQVASLTHVRRLLGDVEGAWLEEQARRDQPPVINGDLIAFKPFFDAVYGDSPSYRAYVAKLEAAQ
jgi:TolB-like protein